MVARGCVIDHVRVLGTVTLLASEIKKGGVKKKKRKGQATAIAAEREKAPEVLITDRLSSFLSVWLLGSLAGSCVCQWGECGGVGWEPGI